MRNLLAPIAARLNRRPVYARRLERAVSSVAPAVTPDLDLVYVVPPESFQGWILDAICREVDQFTGRKFRTATIPLHESLPPSRAYFYSHYGYFRDTVLRQPNVLHARNLLFYTHPRELWYSHDEWIYVSSLADLIVSMCSHFVDRLVHDGVAREKIDVALVGADAGLFSPHTRGTGKIGFCSSYQPRKSGDRMLDVIRNMPHRNFILCGRKWEEWSRFPELASLQNFEYVTLPYTEYPKFYDSIDVFVSVSEVEGGPVPLIESAMSNVVPVCSRTGHAEDIITHGANGYIFDTDASTAVICSLIEQAYQSKANVRETVEHLTWERFSRQLELMAGLTAFADGRHKVA